MRVILSLLVTLVSASCFLSAQAFRWDVGLFNPISSEKHPMPNYLNVSNQCGYGLVALDGQSLAFSLGNHPFNFGPSNLEDIWISYNSKDTVWSRAVNIGASINNELRNYVSGVDPTAQTLYVSTFDKEDQKMALIKINRDGRFWEEGVEMQIDSFSFFSKELVHFFVSYDGRFLITSQRKSKKAGKDLFVSFRKDENSWTAPINLGDVINTDKNESTSFLAADGKTLYFSSNGHRGFGKQDLFISKRLDETWTNWSTPINLGDRINSKENETHFSVPANGKVAYFSYADAKKSQLFSVPLPSSLQPSPVELIRGKILIQGDQTEELTLTQSYNPWVQGLQSGGSLDYMIPHRPGQAVELFKGMINYYPEVKQELIAEDELDYDQFNLLSSIKEDQILYFQRDAEIELLQVQLNQVSDYTKQLKQRFELQKIQLSQKVDQLRFSNDKEINVFSSIFLDTIPPFRPTTKSSDTLYIDRKFIDNELIELRKKFNEYYPEIEFSDENEQYLWGDAMGYEDFKEEVTQELISELAPDVIQNLKFRLYGEVIEELEQELTYESLIQLENKENELRESIGQSFLIGEQSNSSNTFAFQKEETEWEKDLKYKIKNSIQDEVRSQLENALRAKVKATLKSQLTYLTQQSVESDLKAKLDKKVEQQIQEEEAMGAASEGLIPLSFDFQPSPATTTYDFKTIQRNYNLVPIVEGQIIRLGSISFSPNSAILKNKSFEELNQLIAFLKDHPSLKIEIGAHTNGWVSHSFAKELSDKRAEVVVQFLIENGIPKNNVIGVGYGKKKPVASNEDIEGRRMNQRIEMTILKK